MQTDKTETFAELKTYTNWSARATALLTAALCALAIYATDEAHKARLDIESVKDRVDVTTGAVRELTHTINPKAEHFICPKSASHKSDDVDLGVASPCPNADDGQCLKTPQGDIVPVSVAVARCQAGKL